MISGGDGQLRARFWAGKYLLRLQYRHTGNHPSLAQVFDIRKMGLQQVPQEGGTPKDG
jgi:hypothetical protein